MKEKHTAENLQNRLLQARTDFGLHPRVSTVQKLSEEEMREDPVRAYSLEHILDHPALTTDQGSNIASAAERHDLFDWNKCMCHVLNIAVKHGIEASATATDAITKLVGLANHFRKSSSAWEVFKRQQKQVIVENGLRNRTEEQEDDESQSDVSDWDQDPGYISDEDIRKPDRVLRLNSVCKTRWNSTYFLLKRATALEQSIRMYLNAHEYPEWTLSNDQWQAMRELLDVLTPIKDVSERLEGDKYVTISDVLRWLLLLMYNKLHLTATEQRQYPHKADFVDAFKGKICETLDDENQVFLWAMASSLDGRRRQLNFTKAFWENESEWLNVTCAWSSPAALVECCLKQIGEEVKCCLL